MSSDQIERGERCRDAAQAALSAVDALSGALFTVDAFHRLRLALTVGRSNASQLGAMEQAALQALEAGHPARVTSPLPARSARLEQVCFVAPVFVGDEIEGLFAVTDMVAPDLGLDDFTARLAPALASMAMSLERLQLFRALEQRDEEIGALRRQLIGDAMDFRATYGAERDRAQGLAEALAQLQQTYRVTLRELALAVEAKDEGTRGHLQRVSRYGMTLTAIAAPAHADDPQFEYGFLLHDIGKLTVPDNVLTNAGAPTDADWALIRAHPGSGHSILNGIPFLAGAREIVYAHHERWDGTGYPRQLVGEQIPLGAQLFSVCDTYDAMTSDRPYRNALSIADARAELARGSGSQFRPEAVEAFLDLPIATLQAVRAEST